MAYKIMIDKSGGPEVLSECEVSRGALLPTDALVRHEAIGINYIDVTQRRGDIPTSIPGGIGIEASGYVVEVGDKVDSVRVGDRVTYVLGPPGACSSERVYPAERLIRIPEFLSFNDAAAVTCKGITAQYLLKSTYPIRKGDVVMIYGVAGALGQFLVPWAKHLGAYVIGVVSKEESVNLAVERGCDHVLLWGACDVAKEVGLITKNKKADVVFDGVGKLTFSVSLDCLRPRGTMVSIGASSGPPDAVDVATLNSKGSLFLTRPSLAAHTADLNEYFCRANEVFSAVRAGIITPKVWKTFPLRKIREAHEVLESGASTGPIVAIP